MVNSMRRSACVLTVVLALGVTMLATSASAAGSPHVVRVAKATTTSASTSLTAIFSAPTRAHRVLVLFASVTTDACCAISSVTDSAGNAWTKYVDTTNAGVPGADAEAWLALDPQSVTSVTVNVPFPRTMAMRVFEVAGIDPNNAIEQTNFDAASEGSQVTSVDTGSVFPLQTNDLLLAMLSGHSSAETITPTNSAFRNIRQISATDGAGTFATMVCGTTLTTQAFVSIEYTGTIVDPEDWAGIIVVLRPKP